MTDMRREEAASAYVLGYSEQELERLQGQANLFADLTRDILLRAGLAPGMRVLDIGCGAGDVSIIAADIVGSQGAVQGIDPSTEALSLARSRLDSMGKSWVKFAPGTIESIGDVSEFDAIIGRFHSDPSERAAGCVAQSGGILATGDNYCIRRA